MASPSTPRDTTATLSTPSAPATTAPPAVTLASLVQGLLACPGARVALVASADGLAIESAAREEFDAEAVAALAAAHMRQADRLGDAIGLGAAPIAVIEYEHGLLIQARIGAGDWLVILVDPAADVGELLYDIRQHGPALAALL